MTPCVLCASCVCVFGLSVCDCQRAHVSYTRSNPDDRPDIQALLEHDFVRGVPVVWGIPKCLFFFFSICLSVAAPARPAAGIRQQDVFFAIIDYNELFFYFFFFLFFFLCWPLPSQHYWPSIASQSNRNRWCHLESVRSLPSSLASSRVCCSWCQW